MLRPGPPAFSSDNVGGAHWSGSTTGENAIPLDRVPRDIRLAFRVHNDDR